MSHELSLQVFHLLIFKCIPGLSDMIFFLFKTQVLLFWPSSKDFYTAFLRYKALHTEINTENPTIVERFSESIFNHFSLLEEQYLIKEHRQMIRLSWTTNYLREVFGWYSTVGSNAALEMSECYGKVFLSSLDGYIAFFWSVLLFIGDHLFLRKKRQSKTNLWALVESSCCLSSENTTLMFSMFLLCSSDVPVLCSWASSHVISSFLV